MENVHEPNGNPSQLIDDLVQKTWVYRCDWTAPKWPAHIKIHNIHKFKLCNQPKEKRYIYIQLKIYIRKK